MSVRVVSVASRCIILFPSPASTPSRQHQFGVDQHSFGSPALSRCQHTGAAFVPTLLLLHVRRAYGFGSPALSRCQQLRFPRSQSMPTHPHFYFMCGGVPMPTASVCGFSQCVARVFTPLHCSAMNPLRCYYLRFIIVGRTSFNQFSGFSMFSYPWPAPGDGDDYACAHAARCCCASVFGE